jgi:hypothetical protein
MMKSLNLSIEQRIHMTWVGICLLIITAVVLWLKCITWPLNWQKKILDKQLHQMKVLQSLPEKWETQTRFMDIAELMGALSKTWKELMSQTHPIQLEQLNANQLKAKASHVDEQAFIQWLWAMQKQYTFKVIQMTITPSTDISIVDVQFNLELIK